MKGKVIEKGFSLVMFITLVLLSIIFIAKIPIPMKVIIAGIDALAFYWFYETWNLNWFKSNKEKEDKDNLSIKK